MLFNFVVLSDYENISTTKISGFTVRTFAYETKIRLRENLTSEIFYRRKYPDLRYAAKAVTGKINANFAGSFLGILSVLL